MEQRRRSVRRNGEAREHVNREPWSLAEPASEEHVEEIALEHPRLEHGGHSIWVEDLVDVELDRREGTEAEMLAEIEAAELVLVRVLGIDERAVQPFDD